MLLRFLILARLRGGAVAEAQAAEMMAEEFALTRGVDAVVAVTETEAAPLREGQAPPVMVLLHPVRPRCGPNFGERSGFLFVGRMPESESLNITGCGDSSWKCCPEFGGFRESALLTVVGGICDGHDDLAGPGAQLLGPQHQLIPVYHASRMFVAPARFAAGVPVKVLKAG